MSTVNTARSAAGAGEAAIPLATGVVHVAFLYEPPDPYHPPIFPPPEDARRREQRARPPNVRSVRSPANVAYVASCEGR